MKAIQIQQRHRADYRDEEGHAEVARIPTVLPEDHPRASFQFQKYGMLEGVVHHISADATEPPSANIRSDALGGRDRPMGPLAYRALVELKTQDLAVDNARYALAPGMQVSSEINLGTRTILEYVLSPVQKAWHEAGRER